MASPAPDPKSLVCSDCWRDFFDTPAFEAVCTYAWQPDSDAGPEAKHSTTLQRIRNGAAGHPPDRQPCSWCAFLNRELTSARRETAKPGAGPQHAADAPLTVTVMLGLREDREGGDDSPRGNNFWLVRLNFDSCRTGWGWPVVVSACAGDAAAGLVTARALETDVGVRRTQAQVAEWLAECKGHAECGRQDGGVLPKRLVDVGEVGDRKVKVVETKGQKGVWTALSYRRGDVVTWKGLNQSSFKTLASGVDLSTLPQTVQDAVAVTRSSGVRYLWVDSLCILQDSESDKLDSMAEQEAIYSQSFFTIVAASSESIDSGFLQSRIRFAPNTSSLPFRLASGSFGTVSVYDFWDNTHEVPEDREPINTRAWTLQEQLLPRRLLTYASHTLVWRCRHHERRCHGAFHQDAGLEPEFECGERHDNLFKLSRLPPNGEAGFTQYLTCWGLWVRRYTQRSLGQPSDMLPAIAGLAASMAPHLGGPEAYCAGLWQGPQPWHFLWQLYFQVDHSGLQDQPSFRPSTEFLAPSWSWAAFEGKKFLHTGLLRADRVTQSPACEFLGCDVENKPGMGPFGEVMGGELKLKAALRRAWLDLPSNKLDFGDGGGHSSSDSDKLEAEHSGDETNSEASDEGILSGYASLDFEEERESTFVYCLPLLSVRDYNDKKVYYGLLVEPTEDGTFERIGCFNNVEPYVFEGRPVIELVII